MLVNVGVFIWRITSYGRPGREIESRLLVIDAAEFVLASLIDYFRYSATAVGCYISYSQKCLLIQGTFCRD